MEDISTKDFFASHTPEERLMILMSEMLTPIEVIRGYTALIKKQISSMETQELIECVEKIEQAAERLRILRDAIR